MSLSINNDDSLILNTDNFIAAIESGNILKVSQFIAAGVNIDLPGSEDRFMPPLGYAIAYGYSDLVKLLVDSGAKIHDYFIAQLPHLPSIVNSASQDVYEILGVLLREGIDINFPLEEGDTLLHKAVEDTDIKLVKFLVEAGANPHQVNQYNWTSTMSVTYLSRVEDQLEILKILLQNEAIDTIADALFLALSYRDFKAAANLIPLQEDINSRDSEGDWTFLMRAVHEDAFSIVKLLVEAGADVNLKGIFEPEEDFALNLAAFGHNKEIYDYLAPLTSEELRAIAEKTWNS